MIKFYKESVVLLIERNKTEIEKPKIRPYKIVLSNFHLELSSG
tara:strand:- start:36 stop:164 length:129 start_codon:yes stop_codon:yes gene_type:complete